MPRRLRVLMSAYSCEPGKGSEPEVGWQWALHMARFHDVTVLTRANNRPSVEMSLRPLSTDQQVPSFVFHDLAPMFLRVKKIRGMIGLYYSLWQRSAHRIIARLNRERPYDLMHHVTFAGYRYPAAVWGHGVPAVWGPVGGAESFPKQLLPREHWPSFLEELARNVNNHLQAKLPVLARRARASRLILASTREMREIFSSLGFESHLIPTIGLNPSEFPEPPPRDSTRPLRFLFVGKIVAWKGVGLALEAFARTNIHATYSLAGDGTYLNAARSLAAKLGIAERVRFLGRLPRSEVLKAYHEHDVLLFPSLHDSGGYAVIEAMANALPVICLDRGGPALAVQAGSGIKVSSGKKTEVLNGLAQAINFYGSNRSLVAEHGRAARRSVLRDYDWNRKAEQMNAFYMQAFSAGR